MNRLEILIEVKDTLATGPGQPDGELAICFAVDAVKARHGLRGQSRAAANYIKDEVMDYLRPHLTFRQKLNATHSTEEIQAARHAYIDNLIKKESV